MRTSECDGSTRAGRLAKARQFASSAVDVLALADDEAAVSDVFVTLAVTAGIAAADVICCARLGVHARGESHDDAVALLKQADTDAAASLRVLLSLKTHAAYSSAFVSVTALRRAQRAMLKLVALAGTLA